MVWILILLTSSLSALDFDAAKARLLAHHPLLRAADIEVMQGQWDRQGAEVRPNPTLSVDLETYGRDTCDDESNISLFLSQPFETGGKRRAREEVACNQWKKLSLKKKLEALRLLNAFKRAFILVAFKQEEARLAKRQVDLSERAFHIVADKVRGGKLSLMDENKSRLNLALAKSKALDQEKEAKQAYLALMKFWGDTSSCEEVQYPLTSCVNSCPTINLEEHPQALLGAQDSSIALSLLRSAKADRFPDISLGLGYSASFKGDDNSVLAGLEMPLPLFDRNEAEIQRSWLEVEKREKEFALQVQILKFDLKMKEDEWRTSTQQVQILKNEALFWALKSEALIREGVENGKMGKEDLRDAEEVVLDNEKALLDAYLQYHLALVDLEYFYTES